MYVEKAYMITYIISTSLFLLALILYTAVGAFFYSFGQIVGIGNFIETIEKRWMRVVARVIVIITFPISMVLLSFYSLVKQFIK